MGGISNNFPAKHALVYMVLHIQSQNFSGVVSQDHHGSAPVLGPRHQFAIGSPAFLLFQFYETTTNMNTL